MKDNKENRENIYEQYREVLGIPDLTKEEIDKIHSHFLQVGRIIYEHYLDWLGWRKIKKQRKIQTPP